MKICCKQTRKYKATTDSQHPLPVAPNLLNQNFIASGPDRIWAEYITCVATEEGWLYLAGIKDLWNKEIVGYARYRNRQEAIADISEYIEIFYNRQRRHASLGNISPRHIG